MVGTAGFEPATTTPPVWCATRLRYAPKLAEYTCIQQNRESPLLQNGLSEHCTMKQKGVFWLSLSHVFGEQTSRLLEIAQTISH